MEPGGSFLWLWWCHHWRKGRRRKKEVRKKKVRKRRCMVILERKRKSFDTYSFVKLKRVVWGVGWDAKRFYRVADWGWDMRHNHNANTSTSLTLHKCHK